MRALLTFLTEDNVRLHKEYLKNQRLKLSILEKSVPQIKSKTVSEISKMRIKPAVKSEAAFLISDILSHECYFRSFCVESARCKALRDYYSSEASFCYELFCYAKEWKQGFAYVMWNGSGRPVIKHSDKAPLAFLTEQPLLALDLCEHAYFYDYGFDKDEYLRRAIAHLDLSRLCT